MPTIGQLVRKGRQAEVTKTETPALKGTPPAAGGVHPRLHDHPQSRTPPLRKVARVRLSSGVEITAYIPGVGHNLQEHSVVSSSTGAG